MAAVRAVVFRVGGGVDREARAAHEAADDFGVAAKRARGGGWTEDGPIKDQIHHRCSRYR